MTNNMLIKDGAGVSKFIHTVEDSTSAHYNMSIPVDSAGNVATVVSAGQAVATGTMGALVVTQRDALPAGLNLIGNVNIAGAIVSNPNTAIITANNGAMYVAAMQYGWDGSNWRRLDVDTLGKTTVSVQNTINANVSLGGSTALIGSVSISPNGLNIPVSIANTPAVTQSGTWTVQPGNTANTTPWLVSVNSNIAVSVQNVVNVSVSPNGLNIPVSLGGGIIIGQNNIDGQGTQQGLFVHSQGSLFNPISSTWDRMTGTSVGQYVQGNASAGATYLGRALIVGGTDGTSNRTLLTTAGGALVVHVSNTAPGGGAGGTSMTQTVGAAVTTEGYPMLGSDGTNARRIFTAANGSILVHVCNAQPSPSGISMTQTVGTAVTAEGYPMMGSDGTLARRILTTTGGALVVHVSNTAPGGGAGGSAMTQTVGAAVTAEGYPMLGSDGTNARRIYADVNGVQRVSIADTAINVAQNGTWTVQPGNTANTTPWLVSVNSAIAVSVQNTLTVLNAAGTNLMGGVSVRGIVSVMFEGGSDHMPVSVANALRPNTDKVLIGMVSVADSVIKTQDVPGTTGGVALYSQMVSANTTGILVKNAAGQLYGIHAFNTLSTPLYVKMYNKATAPTVGSDAVVARYVIPGNTGGAGFSLAIPAGTPFTTGIGVGITGGITDNNTTAPAADSAYINVYYT